MFDFLGGEGNLLDQMGAAPRAFGFEVSNDPILGGLVSNPADEQMRQQMKNNRMAAQMYREAMPQQRAQALQQLFQLYGPANSALGAMYGPQAMIDFNQATQPVGQGLAGITPQQAQPPDYSGPGNLAGTAIMGGGDPLLTGGLFGLGELVD